ncbi:hypothetical protein KJ991_01615 [Patescibacteria group bacterium]|nr:hypothetical protein [Patescibacteria group bacterium]MBU4057623.1 hypothetical protein [Patescibacteria group bacterium]MBU4115773.1 hypothetical protein [Patescibacteria group bacterium]
MCGIIAILGNTEQIKDSQIDNMLSVLSKRGPDEKNFVRVKNSILGQTRLSIVDIEGGHHAIYCRRI